MNLSSNKIPLIVLAATALTFSRLVFFLFNDPEGPNLLIVTVLAAVVCAVSVWAYALRPSTSGFKRVSLAVLIQVLFTSGLYIVLR